MNAASNVWGVMWMCDAWFMLTRHGPDGTRAHIGYAYRAHRRGAGRETAQHGAALDLQPPAGTEAPSPQPYAH